MKKYLTIISLLFSPAVFAQIPPQQPQGPVRIGAIPKLPNDTIVVKSDTDPDREYVIIKNVKGVIIGQGENYKGIKDGVWREYSAIGAILRLEEFKMGKHNGAGMTFSINGQVQEDVTYKDDSIDGQKTVFMNNGRVKILENYSNGKLNGDRKTFYDDTKIQEESVYKNGQRNGLCKWYLQSGKPSVEYNYINGSLEGQSKEYDANGIIKREGLYKNNDEEGEWKEYQDSVLVKKIIYKGGKIVKEIPVKK